MGVDIQSLRTFDQLAREGARAATRNLVGLAGIEATVDVTRTTLLHRGEVGTELEDGPVAGVQLAFEGPLDGRAVLAFPAEAVGPIAEAIAPGEEPAAPTSSVEEVGNVMLSGFIDGWADHLGTAIDHSPPEYLEGEGAGVLPPAPTEPALDHAFVFTARIEWVGEAVEFYIYMLPEQDPLAELFAGTDGETIPIEKLGAFAEMTARGTETAAENVAAMTGIELAAEPTRMGFAPIEAVPAQLGRETYVGTVVEFTGTPSGFMAVLFDEASAITVARAMRSADGGAELTAADESAIAELGNLMTNGILDGWANVLGSSIEHTPPRLVCDIGAAILDPLAAQVGRRQDHAFVVDAELRTEDVAVASGIYALPDAAELRAALAELDPDRATDTEADVEQVFE